MFRFHTYPDNHIFFPQSAPIPPAAVRSSFAVGESSPNLHLESKIQDEKERQRRQWLKDLEEQKKQAEERKLREKQREAEEEAARRGRGGGGGGGGNIGNYLWTDQKDVEREKRRKMVEWKEEIERQKNEGEKEKTRKKMEEAAREEGQTEASAGGAILVRMCFNSF